MKTEAKIKSQVTPEVIKKMVELAEGFEYGLFDNISLNKFHVHSEFLFSVENIIFLSTLIHRAVEGWNKKDVCRPIQILCNCISFITDEDDPASIEYGYDDNQYQPESLTQAECAILHCLLDVFKQEERDE